MIASRAIEAEQMGSFDNSRMPEIAHLDGRNNWALFLDVDGTIIDIAARPEDVVVEPRLQATLLQLRERLGGALALVSGRSIETLDALFAPLNLDAAGLHGLEVRMNGSLQTQISSAASMRGIVNYLMLETADDCGVIVEDKGATVALHYRLSPERQNSVEQLMLQALAMLGEGYRLQTGKFVYEILPAAADEAAAISEFMRYPPYLGRQPIFAGDDDTDDSAFAMVNDSGGLSIGVGPRGQPLARLRLMSPGVMRRWLEGLSGDLAIDRF